MKRFTETDKWSDPWFQSLSYGTKLVFMYFLDKCNNAGFYEENINEACFHLGITQDQYKGALKGLGRGIKGASGWYWIKNFLKHQKNLPLNAENPAHKQIIFLISEQVPRFSDETEFKEFIAPMKGLLSPIGKGIGKGNKERSVRKTIDKDMVEKIYQAYPRHEGKEKAIYKISETLKEGTDPNHLLSRVELYAKCSKGQELKFIPHAATWFNQKRWLDDENAWICHKEGQNGKNGTHTTKPQEKRALTDSEASYEALMKLFKEQNWQSKKNEAVTLYQKLDMVAIASLPFDERKIIMGWVK